MIGPPVSPRRAGPRRAEATGLPSWGGRLRARIAGLPRAVPVLCAVLLFLTGCAHLIEPAPRAGAAGGAQVVQAPASTTSTSEPAAAVSPAPPLMEEPPPRADDDGDWRTLSLTRGGDTQYRPAVDDHFVVWQGRDSRSPDVARHDDEIYLYDLLTGEIRMLSDNDVQDISPRIEGEWVVWLRYSEGGAGMELVAYSLGSGATKVISSNVEAFTASSAGEDRYFVLAGGSVVWMAGRWPDTEIHHYDLWKSKETVVSDGRGRNRSPDTDGRWVVWLSQTAEGEAVMLADPFRGQSWVVADVTPAQDGPQVDGGLVVWSGWDGSDTEIFLYTVPESPEERAEPVRLTDNAVDDLAPRIDGGMVVWREGRPPPVLASPSGAPAPAAVSSATTVFASIVSPPPSRIVLFEYGIGKERVLSSDVGAEAFPDVRQGLVFWKTSPQEGEGIVLYDAAAEQTAALGRKVVGSGYSVAGHSGRVVWSGWQGEAPQIFLAYQGVRPVAPAPAGLAVSFADTAASPYATAIEALLSAGAITVPAQAATTSTTGAPAATTRVAFHPEASVTRGDAAAMLAAVVGPVESQGQAARPLTRGQLISLVVRAIRANHPGALRLLPVGFRGTVQYFDPDHGDELLLAERNRLLDGLVGFSFDWDVWLPATRGEAAQVVANSRDLLKRGVDPDAGSVPSGSEPVRLLAKPALSMEETVRLVRKQASWRLASVQLTLGEVEVSTDSRGLQELHVTLEATRPDAPSAAVGEFMDRAMGGAAGIASVLNAGRGAQIGLVRVELIGVGGVALVSYSNDLHERGQTLKWDPSVEDVAQDHFPWSRPVPFGGPPSTLESVTNRP